MIHEVSSFNMGKVGELKIDYEHTNSLNESDKRITPKLFRV